MRIICDGIMTVAAASLPALQKQLFNLFSGKMIQAYLLLIIITYIICSLSIALFNYLSMIFTWKASLRFEQSLKRDFLKAILNYRYEDFSKKDVGEYLSIQGNDITELDMDYLTPLIDIIQSINKIIIFGIFLFVNVDWRISAIILIGSILTIAIPKITSTTLGNKKSTYLNQLGLYVSKIKDILDGFKVIQSRTRHNMNQEHEKVLFQTQKMRYQYGKFKAISMNLEYLSLNLVSASAFILAAILLLNHQITIGTCVATFGYINSFIEPINNLMYDFNSVSSLKPIKNKVLTFLNNPTKNESRKKLISVKKFQHKIIFENICINYDNFTLSNINCVFEKGKKYALIGHNGSGKSTMINVLMTYITPISGSIKIDHMNINELDTSYIMYCLNQKEHIFADNFMNNATVFSSYEEADIHRICNDLGINIIDVIKSKENSQQLSGGEKQILGIIRMLAANADILLMDEPFAAIDSNTTDLLESRLLSMQDKTIIMVTHKLSKDLNKFDEILLMDNGQIVQRGTYEKVSSTVEYQKLKEIQN